MGRKVRRNKRREASQIELNPRLVYCEKEPPRIAIVSS
jgi:hypothetical protein